MLTDNQITKLEKNGFNRWTKGDHDRLYINATLLGLKCTYYKTGSINSAYFNGKLINNAEGYRLKGAKTYVDVATGEVCSTRDDLKDAAETLVKSLLADVEEPEAPEAPEAAKEPEAPAEDKIKASMQFNLAVDKLGVSADDLLAAVLWLYQQPAKIKVPGHNEYAPAKSFVIHRDGSIVRCRQEYDPRFGQFFPRSEDGVAQIGGCITIDSVAEWQ